MISEPLATVHELEGDKSVWGQRWLRQVNCNTFFALIVSFFYSHFASSPDSAVPALQFQVGHHCYPAMKQEDFWFYKTAPPLSAADAAFFSSKYLIKEMWTVRFYISEHVRASIQTASHTLLSRFPAVPW